MVRGAAGNNVKLIHFTQVVRRKGQIVQDHPPILDTWKDRIPEGFGLLHDLLGHKVLVTALFGGGDLPIHVAALLLHRLEQRVVDLDPVGGQNRDIPVVQIGDLTGVLDDGGHIGSQKVEPLAVAQDQRTILPGGDQLVRPVGADDAEGIGALDAVEHLDHRAQQIVLAVLIVVFQKLRHHLRIGLGGKVYALCL